jgi:single-strand DNA-binding protein
MFNEMRLTLSGNITRDPEVRHRKVDGRPFTVLAVAVNTRRWDGERNQWVETGTTYYDVVCRGSLGANALASLRAGMPVVAHGRFRVHEWSTETMKGARPGIIADSIGVDLCYGTTTYSKGSASYPGAGEGYEVSAPPATEGGPHDLPEPGQVADLPVDPDGVVSEQDAQAHYARSA